MDGCQETGNNPFEGFRAAAAAAVALPFLGLWPESKGTARRCRKPAHDKGQVKAAPRYSLDMLPESLYIQLASSLDASALCASDAAGRPLRSLNRSPGGPWWALGARHFHGVELDKWGVYDNVNGESEVSDGRKLMRVDWKGRYARFNSEVTTFRTPFSGSEITGVQNEDEVAYCRIMLRTDQLASEWTGGVYVEMEVLANPDNLSLAVVDFEAGGRSSVTFSPDTGAVIREHKIREAPRKVEGAYIQPLGLTATGVRFEGYIGLFIQRGYIAFFRQCAVRDSEPKEFGSWESTGFITDFSWAQGVRLTPCLAFRNDGVYHVRLSKVCSRPPSPPTLSPAANDLGCWRGLNWEAPVTEAMEP